MTLDELKKMFDLLGDIKTKDNEPLKKYIDEVAYALEDLIQWMEITEVKKI